MDEIKQELARHLFSLVNGGGLIDLECVLASLDAYIEAKLKEKNT